MTQLLRARNTCRSHHYDPVVALTAPLTPLLSAPALGVTVADRGAVGEDGGVVAITTIRMRSLYMSAMNILPLASKPTPVGLYSAAAMAGPPSPEKP